MKIFARIGYLLLAAVLLPLGFLLNFLAMVILIFIGWLGKLKRISSRLRLHNFEIQPEASIVIPSWNGKDLLATCLPALQKALDYCGGNHEIVVVDNGSSDGSSEYVKQNFPSVRIISNDTNLGFGKASNLGINSCSKDIVVLLNNDMIVDENFLGPLLQEFEGKPDLFAVTSQIYFWDKDKRREETGKTGAKLRNGIIYAWHESEFPESIEMPVTYAGGGSAAFDRHKLVELGGFDEIYHPFYVEDLDLSFMAWKRGWRILFRPDSIVYHKHRGTIGSRFSQTYIQSIIRKNEIVFVWKNISEVKNLLSHFLWLWLRLVSSTAKGSGEFTQAYFKALKQFGTVAKRRFHESRASVISESEVFSRSTTRTGYLNAFEEAKHLTPDVPLRILFVCPYIPYPPSHGGAVRMYNLLIQLARNHQVYLLSFVENEAELESYEHLKEFCCEVKLIIRRQSPRLNSTLWLRPQSSLDEFYNCEFEESLAKMVDIYDIDIVQYEYTQLAQYLRPFIRAKSVLTEHDVTFVTRYRHFTSLNWSFEKFKALIRWATMFVWELEVCRRFDLICSVSTKEKELLLGYDKKLKVTDEAPTGTDTSFYLPELRTSVEPDSILFVGFFKHLPNVEGLLYFLREVYPLIKKNHPSVKLYVVGSSPPAEVLGYSKDPSICITGFVQDLRDYYAKSAVFVVPILRGAGTRVKIFEAMAAGIPIVSTTLGAEGIDVTDGQNILLADKPQDFADKTVELLRNHGLQDKLTASARDVVVQKYDWVNISKRLANQYYAIWDEERFKRG